MTWPIRSTDDRGGGKSAKAARTRAVQDILIAYRAELYAGRGPGISEDEWRANTVLRPTVGGIPTATGREELHLRTLRARGETDEAAAESAWADSQFAVPPKVLGQPPAQPPQPPADTARPAG